MADLNLQVQEQESSTLRMLQEKAAIVEQMDDIRMQQATSKVGAILFFLSCSGGLFINCIVVLDTQIVWRTYFSDSVAQ